MKWKFKVSNTPGQIRRDMAYAYLPKKCFVDTIRREVCLVWLEPYENRFQFKGTGIQGKFHFEGSYVLEKVPAKVLPIKK